MSGTLGPPDSGAMAAAGLRLEVRGLTKRFPGVLALHGVDFTVQPGEIHALLGENGAGKSTLIKVLTGVYAADGGTCRLGGDLIAPRSPHEAEQLGISTVYQEVNLIPTLSVAENIALGRQPGRWGFLDWRGIRRQARAALARLELSCDVDAELGSLPVAVQQMVAIARALDRRARLLILDEPTASLDEREVAELFTVLRRLRAGGLGIVFVTHFLDQVYALSDRITVLRNGTLVGEYATASLPRLELVGRMLGREVHPAAGHEPGAAGGRGAAPAREPILAARGLARRGAVRGVDLTLAPGEVTGLAGLLGSGRTETARLLFGLDAPDAGEIRVRGEVARIDAPATAIRHGLAFCSEDRKTEGILPNLSVRENLVLALQARRGGWRRIPAQEQTGLVDAYVKALRIKTADAETPIRFLSGGNQQKVLLGRWLATRPALMILDEPTRGIDIGARAEIEQLIARLGAEGMSVLLISSELEEMVRNCARILVLRDRQLVGALNADQISSGRLMTLMAHGAAGAGGSA